MLRGILMRLLLLVCFAPFFDGFPWSNDGQSLTRAASSWAGSSMDCGTASLHSFNDGFAAEDDEGDPPMGFAVDEHLESFAAASSSGLR